METNNVWLKLKNYNKNRILKEWLLVGVFATATAVATAAAGFYAMVMNVPAPIAMLLPLAAVLMSIRYLYPRRVI